MKRDMRIWLKDLLEAPVKKAMPILSFPAIQPMGITVRRLISDSGLQAKAMELVAERTEAECFGSTIRVTDGEVPTVVGSIVSTEEEARALEIPAVGSCRTGLYIDAIKTAAEHITDRPVFAGVIGPFSLAARLLDVTEIMIDCYDEPDMVHTVLEKAASFITDYCKAYKEAGANGVMMAEPVTGLLSPALAEEFSAPYVRRIVEAVQDDTFLVIYHNCGGSAISMIDSILDTGSAAYHFGNAIDMAEMLSHIPEDIMVMGNVDPAGELRNGTPGSVREATLKVMENCCGHNNFVISSGCDIPPLSPWENIDAFFKAVQEFYAG